VTGEIIKPSMDAYILDDSNEKPKKNICETFSNDSGYSDSSFNYTFFKAVFPECHSQRQSQKLYSTEESVNKSPEHFLGIQSPAIIGQSSAFHLFRKSGVKTGTSSLRRKRKTERNPSNYDTKPQEKSFPKTNGSLYQSLDLCYERKSEDSNIPMCFRKENQMTSVKAWLANLIDVQESECNTMMLSIPVQTQDIKKVHAGEEMQTQTRMKQKSVLNISIAVGEMFPGYVCRQGDKRKLIQKERHHRNLPYKHLIENLREQNPSSTLTILTNIALSGNAECRLLISDGAVDSLLDLGTDQCFTVEIITLALRALGSVCCVIDGIKRFEKLNGYERIVDILVDTRRDADERREAVGIIAQVTSPWIEGNNSEGVQIYVLEIFVAIEDFLSKNISLETYLLCSASIANISTTFPKSSSAAASLLSGLLDHSASSCSSVFIQEQLVTIIANIIKHFPEGLKFVAYQVMDLMSRIFKNVCCDSDLLQESCKDIILKSALERTVIKAVMVAYHMVQDKKTASYFVRKRGLVQISLINQEYLSSGARDALISATKLNQTKSKHLSNSSLESIV